MSDRIQVDYRHTTVYYETALDAVGATTSLTLRTGQEVVGANDAYVRKYGTPYNILNVLALTTIAAGAGAAGTVATFDFYGATTGVHFGQIVDTIGVSVVYNDDAAVAVAEPVYCVLQCTVGGPYTVAAAATITLRTDLDPGGLAVVIPREVVTIGAANAVTLYIANGGSTYYESTLKYGGARHTPAIGSARYSYFTIWSAYGAANDCIEVLDSEVYSNVAASGGWQTLAANWTLQAALGQTPTFAAIIGASAKRKPNAEYNNTTAIYVNTVGSDANAGTWQLPKRTLANAIAAAAGRTVVIGGLGCVDEPRFTEIVALSRPIDADYEIVPTIDYNAAGTSLVTAGAANMSIRGCILRGGGTNGAFDNAQTGFIVRECTIFGFGYGIRCGSNTPGTHDYNEIYSCTYGIGYFGTGCTCGVNEIHNCALRGIYFGANLAAGTATIWDNCIYRIGNAMTNGVGMYFVGSYAAGGNAFSYNTIAECAQGIWMAFAGAYVIVPQANVILHCAIGWYMNNGAGSIAPDYCSYAHNTAATGGLGAAGIIPTNNILGDPLPVDPDNDVYALRPDSPAAHLALAGFDGGPERYLIYITGNAVILDGFILDGGSRMSKAIVTSQTRTTADIKWCTIRDVQGTAVDPYATAASTWTIHQLDIRDSGTGIAVWHDGNDIHECLIVDAFWFALWGQSSGGCTAYHLTMDGGYYGLYLTAIAGGWNFRDSIIVGQSNYSAYSDVPQSIFDCCYETIGGFITANASDGNIVVNPLFIDPEADWHLRSLEGGYPLDSLCIDAASDGYDMGCYLVARGVTDESWDSYTFEFEGVECEEALKAKGQEDFETGRGSSALAVKGHKRRFQLSWATSLGMTTDFREVLEYLSTLATSDDQAVTEEQGVIRLHRWPITPMHSEAAVLFDPTYSYGYVAAGIGHRRNAFRGYDLTIQWYDIANGVLDAATATLTSAGAGWVVNEWAGYWIRQSYLDAACANVVGYNYFRILSNTATVLTLSDPYDRIVTVGAAFACSIESDHKIIGNDALYYYLEADSRLRAETQPAFIDAIRCRLADTGVTVRGQMGWVNDTPENRVPDRLELEEC